MRSRLATALLEATVLLLSALGSITLYIIRKGGFLMTTYPIPELLSMGENDKLTPKRAMRRSNCIFSAGSSH
jgi:hypothetical protein